MDEEIRRLERLRDVGLDRSEAERLARFKGVWTEDATCEVGRLVEAPLELALAILPPRLVEALRLASSRARHVRLTWYQAEKTRMVHAALFGGHSSNDWHRNVVLYE